jgi:hypothetical protein
MPTKLFTTGRIKKADYDPNSRQLELHWDNKTILAYKHVPEEVYRRLCSALTPTTYWEDRIAEEYPKGTSSKSGNPDAVKKFGICLALAIEVLSDLLSPVGIGLRF